MIDTKGLATWIERHRCQESTIRAGILDDVERLLAVHAAARALLDAGTQAKFNDAYDKLREVMK